MHVPILKHEIYPTFWNQLKNCFGFFDVIDVITVPYGLVLSPSLIVMLYSVIRNLVSYPIDYEETILNILQNQYKKELIIQFFDSVKVKSNQSNEDAKLVKQMIFDTIDETNNSIIVLP
jgi:hypothetical protein